MKQYQSKAEWIWQNTIFKEVNQYVEFRCSFDLTELGNRAKLYVAVDSNFAAWLNGTFIGTGQFSDFPERKTYSVIDVSELICSGQNVLAILVHYCGQGHFSYIPHKPGLWFILKCGQTEVFSDKNIWCRSSKAYIQGPIARISLQRGYTFLYNAGKADDWISTDYQMQEDWQQAILTGQKDIPQERPVPMLEIGLRPRYEIIAQGLLKRSDMTNITVAKLMQNDFLSARYAHELFDDVISGNDNILPSPLKIRYQTADDNNNGVYVIIDLGREECGFIDLELDTASGTVVDIAVGEHIADMRVRAEVGGRNFASRYITCEGKQHFVYYMERYAGRYIQLHFTKLNAPVKLFYAGLLPANYPVDLRGAFSCSDSLFERIYEVSRHTLHLCMHERYEDCPWREQALYAEDARTEALVGYYIFGEYNLACVSLDLLGRSVEEDSFVKICAPCQSDLRIPFATMSWMVALSEYVCFSGDIQRIEEHIQHAGRILETYCGRLIDDLLPCPQGKKYWHFYDWAEGLSGSIAHTDTEALSGQRFDAILNFFFILAMEKLSVVFDYCGQRIISKKYYSQAEATRKAAHKMFWNAKEKSYVTYSGHQAIEKHYAEMTQALALLAGVPDSKDADALRNRLSEPDNGWVPISLGMTIYKYEAILNGSVETGGRSLKMITSLWQKMIYDGATTFWETIKGHADFNGAGSLCHGFSTVPAYIYQAYILGVKPIDPGFSSFVVRPIFGNLTWASGKIPTPAGDIEISWEKNAKSYKGCLRYPKSLKPIFDDSGLSCEWTVVKI